MATSGSTNFTLHRDEIIKEALLEAQAIDYDDTPDASTISQAAKLLNVIIKSWMADGLHLWKTVPFTLYPEYNKASYLLGPTGDNASQTVVETEIATAATSGATTLTVDSTTGMTAADVIGIEVDDGTLHETTIVSVDSSTGLTITTGIDDDAAVDNNVYTYTSLISRPLRILEAVWRSDDETDTTLTLISQQEYWNLADKTTLGTPNLAFYDPLLTNGKLYLYPVPNDVSGNVECIGQFPFEDFDAITDNADFPVEWLDPIILELAYRLARRYGADREFRKELRMNALEAKARAQSFDQETEPVFIRPQLRQ